MARYTIYLLNEDGSRRSAASLVCVDDAEAINAMLEAAHGAAVELWRDGGLILGRSADRRTFTRAARPRLQRAPACALGERVEIPSVARRIAA